MLIKSLHLLLNLALIIIFIPLILLLKLVLKPVQINLSDNCKFLHLIFKKYINDNMTPLKNTLFIRNISKHYSIKYAWLYHAFIPRFDITAPDRDHAKKSSGNMVRRIIKIQF